MKYLNKCCDDWAAWEYDYNDLDNDLFKNKYWKIIFWCSQCTTTYKKAKYQNYNVIGTTIIETLNHINNESAQTLLDLRTISPI